MSTKNHLPWKFMSPEYPGFHEVVTPENSDCKTSWAFRLNLDEGQSFQLMNDRLELNGVVISGKMLVSIGEANHLLNERDSFYLPAKDTVLIKAESRLVVFLGGAPYEDRGKFFIRNYDLELPLGEIHQVHGMPPYQREVFMTIAQEDEGSRLICGITEGQPGQWTSWPPHQHSDDLEEIYCYFNIPRPKFALHLASREPGVIEEVFPVSTGDFVIIPEGYHPTCGMPGIKSSYFWIMAAHKPQSRRYDLAVNDPNFI